VFDETLKWNMNVNTEHCSWHMSLTVNTGCAVA